MTPNLESSNMTSPDEIDFKVQKLYGAVILLDRLGTKGIWKDNPEKALLDWNLFRSGVLHVEKRMMNENEVCKKYGYISEIETLSDTIIWQVRLTTNDPYDVLKMANTAVSGVVNFAFYMGIFLRGCISIGDYYKDGSGSSIIGPAIDEAAQYYEMPSWIGISLAPSAHLIVREQPNMEAFRFHSYDIPLKEGIERNGIACDWINRFTSERPNEIRQKLIEMMRSTYDVNIAIKYRNTLDFVDNISRTPTSK